VCELDCTHVIEMDTYRSSASRNLQIMRGEHDGIAIVESFGSEVLRRDVGLEPVDDFLTASEGGRFRLLIPPP
jgi:hypothetical protein